MSYDGWLCPYCDGETWCETVDVGIGLVQGGPHICLDCDSYEIRDTDFKKDDGSFFYNEENRKHGWYRSEWAEKIKEKKNAILRELNMSRLEKVDAL